MHCAYSHPHNFVRKGPEFCIRCIPPTQMIVNTSSSSSSMFLSRIIWHYRLVVWRMEYCRKCRHRSRDLLLSGFPVARHSACWPPQTVLSQHWPRSAHTLPYTLTTAASPWTDVRSKTSTEICGIVDCCVIRGLTRTHAHSSPGTYTLLPASSRTYTLPPASFQTKPFCVSCPKLMITACYVTTLASS